MCPQTVSKGMGWRLIQQDQLCIVGDRWRRAGLFLLVCFAHCVLRTPLLCVQWARSHSSTERRRPGTQLGTGWGMAAARRCPLTKT